MGRRSQEQQPVPKRQSRLRLAVMGLVLVAGVPVVFLGALELGLRVAGFGYPTAFFLKEESDGEPYLRSNHKFSFRFFPASLARAVLPMRIPVASPEDTYRILIFGESAANGDPDPAYGFGRQLEILLEGRFPGTDIEVVNTAVTAINSHVILPIARDSKAANADLWIIYMGNNEVIGPFGASTIFGSKAPPLPLVRASLTAKKSRLGQLMKSVSETMQGAGTGPDSWEGINMFAQNVLHPEDPSRMRVTENFRANLEDILEAGQEAGVPVLLSTVATNIKDCAPFASLHREGLSPRELADWEAYFAAGKQFESQGDYREALNEYGNAAAIDSSYAELQFRIGRCHGLSGNLQLARQAMEAARDADALAVRADSSINQIIRDLADDPLFPEVTLVDSEARIAAASPAGFPGKKFFYEHVHFTFLGNYEMAKILAEEIVGLSLEKLEASDSGSWPGPATCQRKLAVTLWDQARMWTSMAERQSNPPFTSRLDNAANLAHSQYMAGEFMSRVNPRLDRLVYERALEAWPDDYLLHARLGDYLLLNGDYDGAIEAFTWITGEFPEFEGGHQQLGIALMAADRIEEAKASFQRVLEINPDYAKAETALKLINERSP